MAVSQRSSETEFFRRRPRDAGVAGGGDQADPGAGELVRGSAAQSHDAALKSPRSAPHSTNAPLEILEAVEEAKDAAGALQTVPRGRLRINAPVSFGLLHLAPAITDFLQRFPDVSVEMLVNDRVVDLLEGEFDVGVCASASCATPA